MKIANTIILIALATNAHATTENAHNKIIAEAKSEQIGGAMVRHFRFFGDPCLTAQILKPGKTWKILSSKKFCSFEGKSFMTDFTDAGFENIEFSTNGVRAVLSITPLKGQGYEVRECLIPVNGYMIGGLSCSEPKYEYN